MTKYTANYIRTDAKGWGSAWCGGYKPQASYLFAPASWQFGGRIAHRYAPGAKGKLRV